MKKFESLYQDYPNSRLLLEKALQSFKNTVNLTPVIGIELEFSLRGDDNLESGTYEDIIASIKTIAQNQGIQISTIEVEEGKKQYEINFVPTTNLLELTDNILAIKDIAIKIASNNKLEVLFDAKPYADNEPGNGMHINISLLDEKKNNIFASNQIIENIILLNSLAGLLNLLPASLVFVTRREDFLRFKPKIELPKDQLRHRCNSTNAPVNVSWGINNRTTALRVTNTQQGNKARRIEHRVPAANANPYLAIMAILHAMEYGIMNKLSPAPQIWGNAFDQQYSLQPLPINMMEAIKYYHGSSFEKFFLVE